MKVNIISPPDNWILQKIGLELLKIKSKEIEIIGSRERNLDCDINYYINWCYWRILNPNLDKSDFDVVLFTHLDKINTRFLDVLDKADLIVCMSMHGKQELIKQKIEAEKIRICPYFGVSINVKKKIIIGTSGRDYKSERKNRIELENLKRDLDSNIFEFKHSDRTNNDFFSSIDYYLQTSTAEGGSMDILNAIYSRTPVISRNIGFIYSMASPNDFIYKNYEELLSYLQNIEKGFKEKDLHIKNHTWDNFRNWHITLFKDLQF